MSVDSQCGDLGQKREGSKERKEQALYLRELMGQCGQTKDSIWKTL
jgi:hypothetical protein